MAGLLFATDLSAYHPVVTQAVVDWTVHRSEPLCHDLSVSLVSLALQSGPKRHSTRPLRPLECPSFVSQCPKLSLGLILNMTPPGFADHDMTAVCSVKLLCVQTFEE